MIDSEIRISAFAHVLPKVASYSFSPENIGIGLSSGSLNDNIIYYDQTARKYNFLDVNFYSKRENEPYNFYKQGVLILLKHENLKTSEVSLWNIKRK